MLIKPLLSLLLAATVAFGSVSQAPIASESTSDSRPHHLDDITANLPIYSLLPCPESCPCCEGCESLPDFCDVPIRTTYNTVRNLVGCESLPLDTPLCSVGECDKQCLCREVLFREVRVALLSDDDHYRSTDQGPRQQHEVTHPDNNNNNHQFNQDHSSLSPGLKLEQSFPFRLQPWYLMKPPCPCWCIGCPWCDSTGYLIRPGIFRSVRSAVGCDSVPATTDLCPIGRCRDGCVCRERLLKDLEGALFRKPEEVDDAR